MSGSCTVLRNATGLLERTKENFALFLPTWWNVAIY